MSSHNNTLTNTSALPLLAIFLLCTAFVLTLITAWVPTMEHVSDPMWSSHQRFHAFREVFISSFFALAGIALCLGPLRKGSNYALMTVGFLGIGVVGGFWVGIPITGTGKEELAPFINHGLQLVTLISGYLIAHYATGEKSKSHA